MEILMKLSIRFEASESGAVRMAFYGLRERDKFDKGNAASKKKTNLKTVKTKTISLIQRLK